MRLIGDNNAGRCVGEHLLRELFAFFTGPAFTDVGIDGDKAAVGQWCPANIKGSAIWSGSFEMMGLAEFALLSKA